MLIELNHPELSIRRQCELLDLNRSSFYYQPAGETELNLKLMRLIDEQYEPPHRAIRFTLKPSKRG